MPTEKIIELSRINNTFFAEAPDAAQVKIAGVLKSIEDKETPTGTAKRFKGDFAMLGYDKQTYRAKYAFFPANIRDAILAAVSKIGKWDSVEFVFSATKSQSNQSASWSVSFSVNPRLEQPRVVALLG